VTDRPRLVLMLAPALLVLLGLFLAGLGLTFLRSLRYLPTLGLTEPDLAAYAEVLTDPGFLRSFGLSLWIASASTLIAAVLALAAALLLRQTFPGRTLVSFLVQANLTIPHISQSGSFARLAYSVGLIGSPADFPALTHDPYAIGIILLYVWKEVPFILLILLANLQTLGEDHEAVARSLGASRWQAFFHVLLPMILPGLVTASALVFAFAFGAYEVPLVLGQHAPKALPVLAWQAWTDTDLTMQAKAMATAMIIGAAGLVLLVLVARGIRLGDRDAR
jgi:putative spermidine/putrescine transport system permease protein